MKNTILFCLIGSIILSGCGNSIPPTASSPAGVTPSETLPSWEEQNRIAAEAFYKAPQGKLNQLIALELGGGQLYAIGKSDSVAYLGHIAGMFVYNNNSRVVCRFFSKDGGPNYTLTSISGSDCIGRSLQTAKNSGYDRYKVQNYNIFEDKVNTVNSTITQVIQQPYNVVNTNCLWAVASVYQAISGRNTNYIGVAPNYWITSTFPGTLYKL